MAKKIKELRCFNGKDIRLLQGYDGWVKCTLDDGETFSISLRLLFSMFDDYEINVEKYGKRWRAIGFYNREEGKLIRELSWN